MERVQTMNPFAKRESHDKRSLLIYRILTFFTWLLLVVLSVYFGTEAPANGRSIWDQNQAHPTPFSVNPEITSVYWCLLLLLQLGYIYFLSAFNSELVTAAANVGSHFIANNIFQAAFILLWCHSHFWVAEIIIVLNLFNLTSLYFRHLKTPRFVHYPIVTGPLAFTFVAMFVNGAAMVGAESLAARICANVAVWSILFYGLFFLVAFKDYAFAWEMSVLSLALTVQQFRLKIVALQWVFAAIIFANLLSATLAFVIPTLFGRELVLFREIDDVESIDSEREPLLEDD